MRVSGSATITGSVLLGLLLVTAAVVGPLTVTTARGDRAVEPRATVDAQDEGPIGSDGVGDCVTGDVLAGNEIADGYVGIRCETGATGNTSTVTFYGNGGFAYIAIIEIPADAPSKGIAAKQGEYVHRTDLGPVREGKLNTIWGAVEPLLSDEVALTQQTPVLYQSTRLDASAELPPGVYEVQVIAYEPTTEAGRGSEGNPEIDARETVPRHSSTVRLTVGDCAIEPSPGEKLRRLDRRKLELIEDIAQLRALYTEKRAQFAAGTATGTAIFGYEAITAGKTVAKKGAKGAAEAIKGQGDPMGTSMFTLGTIKERITDPAWRDRNRIINRYYARTKELERVNREYSRTVERVRRCAGVTVPESYDGLTAAERQRAKELNGWPYGDGTEPNPYQRVRPRLPEVEG